MSDDPATPRVILPGKQVIIGAAGLTSRADYVITCNQPVVMLPPWEKIQFERYDSELTEGGVMTVAQEFDFARQERFTVTHNYRETEAVVEISGIKFDAVPARLLADGFTPWALIAHDCLNLHAASVLIDDTLFILAGYHDAGKSTAARALARVTQGLVVSDDCLTLRLSDDGVWACAAFWEEDCPQTQVRPASIRFAIIDDNSGEFQKFGPSMSSAQFVGGMYCGEEFFDKGAKLIESMLERSGYQLLPNRPSVHDLRKFTNS